jgi:hypothetical protein
MIQSYLVQIRETLAIDAAKHVADLLCDCSHGTFGRLSIASNFESTANVEAIAVEEGVDIDVHKVTEY